ncbi:MAG: sodium:calcium antiporter [Actinomycetota bacterium]|nr:sodium:calcium antiporter [Actinomycetota bacterium]
MATIALLPVSILILLAGALLFTNGVEWLGAKLELGQGAVGSLLAAVATALPESLIPVTAVVEGGEGSADVAVGAILGAPFLLSTAAMALVGGAAYGWRRRRPQGKGLEVHFPTLERDLAFFLVCFAGGFVLGIVDVPRWLRVAGAVLLVAAYAAYVRFTLAHSGEVAEEEELKPLSFDMTKSDPPRIGTVLVQLVVALGAIVGGAHIFVDEIIHASESLGIAPLVLSLVIAPFATELPEKVNSVFWVRDGKDTLALGNITGAMVFQSTLPVAFGLAATDWNLETASIVVGLLTVVGGLLALFELQVRRRFIGRAVALWAALWLAFVVYVAATA